KGPIPNSFGQRKRNFSSVSSELRIPGNFIMELVCTDPSPLSNLHPATPRFETDLASSSIHSKAGSISLVSGFRKSNQPPEEDLNPRLLAPAKPRFVLLLI